MSDRPFQNVITGTEVLIQFKMLQELLVDEIQQELRLEQGDTRDRKSLQPSLTAITDRKKRLREAMDVLLVTGIIPPGVMAPPADRVIEKLRFVANLPAAIERGLTYEEIIACGDIAREIRERREAEKAQSGDKLDTEPLSELDGTASTCI